MKRCFIIETMKLDHLDGLVAFVTVARKRSFTAAAAELDVSPSAVSQAMRQLEARLGVRLLHRTTRSVSLTEAGANYLERVAPAVGDLADAAEALAQYRDRPSGTLRINTSRVAYAMVLRQVVPVFAAEHPEVTLEFAIDDGFSDIVATGFDAGIRLGENVQRDMVAQPLGRELEVAVAAAPAYLAAHGTPRTLEDLARHNCLRFRYVTSGAVFRWEFMDDGRLVELAIPGSLIANDPWVAIAAALDGVGLAYSFTGLMQPYFEQGSLVRVLAPYSPRFPGFHLYYSSRRQVPPKLRAFIGCAQRVLG